MIKKCNISRKLFLLYENSERWYCICIFYIHKHLQWRLLFKNEKNLFWIDDTVVRNLLYIEWKHRKYFLSVKLQMKMQTNLNEKVREKQLSFINQFHFFHPQIHSVVGNISWISHSSAWFLGSFCFSSLPFHLIVLSNRICSNQEIGFLVK